MNRFATLAPVFVVFVAFGAAAQTQAVEPAEGEARAVGDATHRLLDLQRASRSGAPGAIRGDVAALSYQRLLDSFKIPIPAHFGSAVRKAGGSTGTDSK